MRPIILYLLTLFTSTALPDTVTLSDGEQITGELVDLQAGFVQLRLNTLQGAAIQRIAPEEIAALKFEDEDEPLESKALRRASFIPFISEKDTAILTEQLEAYHNNGDNLTALSYAKIWHPKNQYPSLDSAFRALLIRASLSANLEGEAAYHAQNWLQSADPPLHTSLPWTVLAQQAFEAGDYERALWLALRPIAHRSLQSDPQEELKAIAAKSYQALGHPELAAALLTPLSEHSQTSDSPTPLINLPSLEVKESTFESILKTRSPK